MFDPFSGVNAPGSRFLFKAHALYRHPIWLPISMRSLPEIQAIQNGVSPLTALRSDSLNSARLKFCRYRLDFDFPFWAAYVCRIPDINDPDNLVPLILNSPQCKVIDTFLRRREQRLTGRYLITKSQPRIGLTTVIQAYIFWSQTRVWHGNSYTAVPRPLLNRTLKANLLRNIFTQRRVFSSLRPLSDSDMADVRWERFDTDLSSIRILRHPNLKAHFGPVNDVHRARGIHFDYIHFPDLHTMNDPAGIITRDCYRSASGSIDIDPESLMVLEGDAASSRNPFFTREIRAAFSSRSLLFPIRL